MNHPATGEHLGNLGDREWGISAIADKIARRSDVVGIYPNDDALIRLAAGLLVETNDEWLVAHRYISHASMQMILPELEEEPSADQPALKGALAGVAMSTT